MIFKQQLTDITTVLNNTGNTTKLLTSFNALDIAQQKVLLSSSLLSEKQKQLNNETADAIEKQLEEMCVQNATEIVTEALTLKNEELIVAKEYLAETGKELASVSELESAEFIASATKAGICSQQFAALQLQKILCNENRLDPANDINGLLMLAKAAEISGDAIAQLSGLKIAYDNANGDCVTCIKNLHRNDYSEIAFRFFYYLIPIIL